MNLKAFVISRIFSVKKQEFFVNGIDFEQESRLLKLQDLRFRKEAEFQARAEIF